MTASDHKKFYSRFLKGHEGKLHFSAHSHHFWPDVTRVAHLQYWDDCAAASDEKWNKIFGEVIPKAQNHIAKILGLSEPKQVAFAPNTHELMTRILSLFLGSSELTILTTSSEFHSLRRQLQRISEIPSVKVETVSTETLLQNRKIFFDELKTKLKHKPRLFIISQVFFDSGLALTDDELLDLHSSCDPETIMVVDGYHAFGALPVNLSRLEGKIFYLAGGYKYAQAGEGAAFVIVPKGDWRPAYTGWFAEYGDLTKPAGANVGYTRDGLAFMGATQDPSGLYRFNAVWDLFQTEGLDVEAIHRYIKGLETLFLGHLSPIILKSHKLTPLIPENLNWHGHFLTYEGETETSAAEFQDSLKTHGILIDRRGKRLRFGFGLYHNETDVLSLTHKLNGIK